MWHKLVSDTSLTILSQGSQPYHIANILEEAFQGMDEKHMEDQTILVPVHSADFCRRILAEEQNEVHNDGYMIGVRRAEADAKSRV